MVFQTYLFFSDVYFLDIINKLLLQPVTIVIFFAYVFFQQAGNALPEIGREINTTGSKAYDSTIQKCVVLMKDELEKAKEQVLNVL